MDSPWAICVERGPWQGKGNKCLARSHKRALWLERACATMLHAQVFPHGLWFTANREVERAVDRVRQCAARARATVSACEQGNARRAHAHFNDACRLLVSVVDPEAKRLLVEAFILGPQRAL